MPRLARLCGGSRVMSSPRKRIRPERTGSRPVMLSMMVVRPAPLRPTSETTSPSPTSSVTPRRMCAGPRKVFMASTSSSTRLSFAVLSRKRDAKKDVGDVLVRLDRFRRAVGEEFALMHHDDAVRVPKHHVHVVLDDDRGHGAGTHNRRHGVHDLRLVARAHPARRLVEKEQFRTQRIGNGDVEQLALALRQTAGRHGALAGKTELAKHVEGLPADVLVVVRKRRDLHHLALARENRQCDIVEDRKRVEQIDDLEAAGDARPDALVDLCEGDVFALEQNASAVRLEMTADQVDERGLAGAVRAHEREKFALVDGEIHAIAGVYVAKLLAEIDRLEKDHAGFSFRRSLAAAAAIAPTMPVGNSMTSSTRTTPSRSCQYSVVATAQVLR